MKQDHLALFLMVDALGARFLREHEFLPELEFRSSLRTVLGYSCSCEPTILTGRLPREHGHGAMYQLRQGPSVLDVAKSYQWLPAIVRENHRIRARISAQVAKQVSGYFSLYECPVRLLPRFDLVEKRSIFEPGGIRQGKGIFDVLREWRVPWRAYDWRHSEEENLNRVERDIETASVPWIFLYLPHLDGLQHEHGLGSPRVLEHLAWYQKRIRRLLELGDQHAENLECYIFSDHGMADIHGEVDILGPIERAFGQNGKRYLAFYDSTMARFWCDDVRLRQEIADHLRGLRVGRVLEQRELTELGSDFSDRSQGDLTFLIEEGLLILPSYMGHVPLAGMHGYHPDASYSAASFLSLTTPASEVNHLKDVYPIFEASARLHASSVDPA